uniref:BED-type domain-containing protein n=1 Tax=Rhabditophanes sp. KR3021 TaxID=114890 RepID=A0AC35TWN9_9BILA
MDILSPSTSIKSDKGAVSGSNYQPQLQSNSKSHYEDEETASSSSSSSGGCSADESELITTNVHQINPKITFQDQQLKNPEMTSIANEMDAKLGDVYPITESSPGLMEMLQRGLLSGAGLDHNLTSILSSSNNKNGPQDIESLFKANGILPPNLAQLTAAMAGPDATTTLTPTTSPTTDLLQNNHLKFDATKSDGQHNELFDNLLFKREQQHRDEREQTASDNTSLPSTSPSSSESPINENNVLTPTSQIKTENILSTFDALTKSNIITDCSNVTLNNTKNNGVNNSPWMRSAGRKKTHPVWKFFRDIKDKNEEGGTSVICLNCDWKGEDKSPNNLKTHLKRVHENDGVYEEFTKALARTPTQPYVKRNRAGGFNNPYGLPNGTPSSNPSMPNGFAGNGTFDSLNLMGMSELLAGKSLSEQEALLKEFNSIKPEMDEPANKKVKTEHGNGFDVGNGGFDLGGQGGLDLESLLSLSNQNFGAANLVNNQGDIDVLGSMNSLLFAAAMNSGNNQNNATQSLLASLAGANQLANLARQPTPVTPLPQMVQQQPQQQGVAPFSLTDEACMKSLMGIAKDMDILIAYRAGNAGDEFTFSKHESGRADYTKKCVVLFETREEIKTCVRMGDNISDVESWTKTDPSQLQWALRGKVQSTLF